MTTSSLSEPTDVGNVDKHIGARVRGRRLLLGLSVEMVALRARIDPAAYPFLESGAQRVSAAKLFELGRVLGVPTRFFFDLYSGPGSAPEQWAAHPSVPVTAEA